jgi:hypothetical protein
MILYNITINIDKDVHDEWLPWMKNHYVPSIMATGYFSEYKIMRLMNEQENDGSTYSFQYFSTDLHKVKEYQQKKEGLIIKPLYQKYQNKFVEFRSMLEILE